MRLIDADKFEVFTCIMPEEYRKSDETIAAYSGGMDKVLKAIDAAPTIDPDSLRPTAELFIIFWPLVLSVWAAQWVYRQYCKIRGGRK